MRNDTTWPVTEAEIPEADYDTLYNAWLKASGYADAEHGQDAFARAYDAGWRPGPVPTVTGRGFQHHDDVPSEYGGGVKVYESSAAMGPHIWLRCESPVSLNEPEGEMQEAVAHLTLDNARLLRDQLTQLIDNHYQL